MAEFRQLVIDPGQGAGRDRPLDQTVALRAISAAVVARMQALHGAYLEVTTRDLAAHPIPHLTGAYLAGQSADVLAAAAALG